METSELQDLEEFVDRSRLSPNERSDYRGLRSSVIISPVGVPRKGVARPKAPPQREPIGVPPPISASKPNKASLGRLVSDYRGLVETCRDRCEELAISRLELDRLAGLPVGYSGKLLGKTGGGSRPKRMWPIGLEAMLGTLGLRILLIEDEAATARTLALRTPVDANQVRLGASHWRNVPEAERCRTGG